MLKTIAICFAMISACMSMARQSPPTMQTSLKLPEISAQLEVYYQEDQEVRARVRALVQSGEADHAKLLPLINEMRQGDQERQAYLQQVYARFGWPSTPDFNQQAIVAAFFIAQHASPAMMESYRDAVEQSYQRGDLEGKHYPMYVDRLCVFNSEPQIYGTQPKPSVNGQASQLVWPVVDFNNLDMRRAKVGLEPFEQYLKVAGLRYDPSAKPSLLH